MGFFSSLKRNTEIIKAENDIPNISVRMSVIRRDLENYMCVKKETVQDILDWVNKTHQILNAEIIHDLGNIALYTRGMDPNLSPEVKLLWINKTHRIPDAEMIRELDNNTSYIRSMYPNLISEIKLLEAYRDELKYILATKFPEENA